MTTEVVLATHNAKKLAELRRRRFQNAFGCKLSLHHETVVPELRLNKSRRDHVEAGLSINGQERNRDRRADIGGGVLAIKGDYSV